MPSGAYPDFTSRKVLYTGTHTVKGQVKIPNGATDFYRTPPYQGYITGPGCIATCVAGVQIDNCSALFWSYGPESQVFQGKVGAQITVGSQPGGGRPSTAGFNFDDVDSDIYNFYDGRGMDMLDSIEGGFQFSISANLVLDTYGEDDIDIPDDQYPNYGGVRIVGEFPSNYALLHWVPVEGALANGTITLHGRTASASGVGNFSGEPSWSVNLYHSPGASASGAIPAGRIEASINMDGYPVAGDSAGKTFSYMGTPNMGGEVGAGWARVWVQNEIGGVPSGGTGGVAANGGFATPREAKVLLDAVAMDHPHPHACAWRAILGYQGTTDQPDADGYYTIIDPPIAIVTELTGQSVSADVYQRLETINVVAASKEYDAFVRNGGRPARGYLRNGNFVTYDHYRNEVGVVKAWIVPPPGEVANDWRVGFLGLAEDALTIDHAETLQVPADPNGFVAEGYRYAEVASDGTVLTTAGKAWPLGGDGSTLIDLCFPDGLGSGSSPTRDLQDTRWPLDAQRKSTVNTPYWGVSVFGPTTISDGTLASINLKRLTPAKLHFLAPYVPPSWEKEVPDDEITSQGDTYTVEHWASRLAIGDVDGRQGIEVPHVRKQVNNAPGRLWSTDYFHLSVGTVATLLAEIPGWSATVVGDKAAEPAWYLGLGFVRQNGQWLKQFDRGVGTLKSQPRYDSMFWSGEIASDVFQVGGGGAKLTLVGRKVFRGSAYGAVKADATVYYSDADGGNAGNVQTQQKRYGLIGPTLADPDQWGLVGVGPGQMAGFGGLPRRIQRGAFGTLPKGGKGFGLDVSRTGRWARAYGLEGTLRIGFAANYELPNGWHDADTGLPADWARIRYPRVGGRDPLYVLAGKDGSIALYRQDAEGGPLTMSKPIGSGQAGELLSLGDGPLMAWRVSGGTVYLRRFGRDEAAIGGEATTNLSGLDEDSGLAAGFYPDPRTGKRRIGLLITVGGTYVLRLSDDGITFDP